jgi:hypothetical protein
MHMLSSTTFEAIKPTDKAQDITIAKLDTDRGCLILRVHPDGKSFSITDILFLVLSAMFYSATLAPGAGARGMVGVRVCSLLLLLKKGRRY